MSNNILPMKAPQAQSMLDAALRYAEAGIKIFATTADGKAPAISNRAWSNKLGRDIQKGQGGLHLATTDRDLIAWMFSWRNAGGIGMPCGKTNNVIVADFDIHKEGPGGNAHARLLEFEDAVEATHRVRTRNGGLHAYFAYRTGHGKHELGENIEVQTDGSYVLLPPSKGYRVENLVFAEDWDPPPWEPVGSVAQIRTDMDWREVSEDIQRLRDEIYADRGQWHNSMVRLTAHLVGIGWSDAQILQFVPEWTAGGYTHAETFHQVATAVAGARAKWDRRDEPKTTDDARIQTFAKLWARSSPAARKTMAEMIEEATNDNS
jgi:hypothetical protein